MECAECGVRSSVGYCHECNILLCEVCGNECERCHKTVCRSHIQRTSSGRSICVACVVLHYESRAQQSKELREKRATRAELGQKKRKVRSESRSSERKVSKASSDDSAPPPEDLSFASLMRDEEPVAVAIPEFSPPPVDTGDPDASPLYDKEALNKRVLTGSARARNPAGFSGLGLGGLSWVFIVMAYRASDVGAQRGILMLMGFILAVGTVVWTWPHARSKEQGGNRLAARFGLVVGGLAFLLTLLIYIMRGLA